MKLFYDPPVVKVDSDVFKDSSIKWQLSINDEVYKALEKNPLLHKQIAKSLDADYAEFKKKVGELAKTFGAKIKAAAADKAKVKEFEGQFNSMVNAAKVAATADAKDSVSGHWNAFAKNDKEYKKYKLDVGIQIGFKVGGLAIGIATMASAGASFGATSIPAVIALVRSSAQLGDTVNKAMKDVLKDANEIKKAATKIAADFKTAKGNPKASKIAGDFMKQLGNKALGVDIVATAKTCQEGLKRVKPKCAGLIVNTHKLYAELQKLKVAMLTLPAVAQNDKRLSQMDTKVAEMQQKVEAKMTKIETVQTVIGEIEPKIEEIKNLRPEALKYLEKGAEVVLDLGFGVMSPEDLAINATLMVAEKALGELK